MSTEPVLPDFTDAPSPLWVFGYGSLIWQPDFPVAEMRLARAPGWSRSFCMWSIHHRGTQEHPGLVLAMDRAEGSWCDGLALRAAPGSEAETLAMLRERELVSSAYVEAWLDLELRDQGGGQITALAYVMDRSHAQYTGALSLDEQAAVIARAAGGRGLNRDYLYATSAKLAELGIDDTDLTWLAGRVRALEA
ncbi:gamma-glutamylcyclotransferase [Falsigemmobacter faecalis]|uniref:glutathione-specific gamma-glutamylcyclotransferase n=1 Tax=Falsigemmobacter faecalis TaxID=2488730 RepID=A0A3P3DR37_9RHOB|nr:gamma-glutamylcyclotransferase [Falsigemmobacter faecalis]RRH75108.1 gamma-glutamylcyclotransferase [Falsigemmobacter faecalis]